MPDIELKEYTLEDLKRREKKILGKPQTDRRVEKLRLVRAEIEKRMEKEVKDVPAKKTLTSSKSSDKQPEKKIEKVPKDEVKTATQGGAKIKPGEKEIEWPKALNTDDPNVTIRPGTKKLTSAQIAGMEHAKKVNEMMAKKKAAKKKPIKKAIKKNENNRKSETDKAGKAPVPTGSGTP